MSDQPTFNRRRVLELSGVGTALAIAGCAGQGQQRRVTVSLQPTQDDLEPAQLEAQQIQQQQLTGEISDEEAQRQLLALQEELFDGLIETATEEAESLGLTVEDSIEPDRMLVSGSEADILDFLDLEIIANISDAEDFEQLQQQQQQQPTEAPVDEDTEETEDNDSTDGNDEETENNDSTDEDDE